MRLPWGRPAAVPAASPAAPDDVARQQERRAAEQALRAALRTPSGGALVDVLVAPWVERRAGDRHGTGPLPPADAVLRALQHLGERPPAAAVERLVAAEPLEQRGLPGVAPAPEDRALLEDRRAERAAAWSLPQGFTCDAHAVVTGRLQELEAQLDALGERLPELGRVPRQPRTWPGRDLPRDLRPPFLVAALRSREARGDLTAPLLEVVDRATALVVRAEGLPAFDPADWVLAATDAHLRAPAVRGTA